MKWIDHQIETNADLKRNVEEYLHEMMIEQKLPVSGRVSGRQPRRIGTDTSHVPSASRYPPS